MIPARIGSTRLKMKNLALINGKPLIYYAIQAAKGSGVFDKIVLNSENQIFDSIANEYNVEFYRRPERLGSSETKSDEVIADFINKHKDIDIVAWVNPIAPFQTGDEINRVVKYFIDNNLDSLITVEEKNVHCFYDGKPINYDLNQPFARTQDLIPVETFCYTLMMWNSICFLKEFKKNGHAMFCGKFNTHTVNKLSAIIIKDQRDLQLADYLMQGLNKNDLFDYSVKYHPTAQKR